MRGKAMPLIGLMVLAAVTAGLVVLAMLHVRPREVGTVAVPPRLPAATGASTPTPPAGPRTPRPRTAEAVKGVMQGDTVDIVVLGDASGIGDTKWVAVLAKNLAEDGRVRLVTTPGPGQQEKSQETGSGPRTITLRNMSEANLTLRGAAGRIDQLVPAETDLVIVSFGHRESQGSISSDLEELWNKLPASATALVIVQNPEKGSAQQAQRDRMRAVADWANENKAPMVDVFDAFTRAPEPLADLLDRDSITPNGAGSRLWADSVRKALG